jgi:hypothetical protein
VLDILNFQLAPFLATWHPRLRAFEEAHPGQDESAWSENAAFRAELRALQQELRPYIIGLGDIAGLRDPERHLERSARHVSNTAARLPRQPPARTDIPPRPGATAPPPDEDGAA